MIYLDNAATTRVHPEVVAAIGRALLEDYGNPSSRHAIGLAADRLLGVARATLAGALGARPSELVFTSGGTEANALALLGTVRRRGAHLLVSALEHPSVIETARSLASAGIELELVPATSGGHVAPSEVEARVRPETALVAVMHVNNEIGIVQPVAAIAARVRARNPHALVLCDAVQSFTHLPVSLAALGADLITVAAHKIHGPKGVGCLAFTPRVKLSPLWGGGDQEANRRAGTENVPGIVGLARAVELAASEGQGELERRCRDAIVEQVTCELRGAYAVGDAAQRAPQLVAIAIPGLPSEVLVNALEERGVCVSSGSACHSRRSLRSHVLEAIGVPRDHGVVRFSCSRLNTEEEAHAAAAALVEAVHALRP